MGGARVVELDGVGEATEIRRRGVEAPMRRQRVESEEDGVKGRVERRGPGVRIGGRGDGSPSPCEGGATLVDLLGRGVGGGNAGVGEELKLKRFARNRNLGSCAELDKSSGGSHVGRYGCGSSRKERRGPEG